MLSFNDRLTLEVKRNENYYQEPEWIAIVESDADLVELWQELGAWFD